jgi:hypothetical protein
MELAQVLFPLPTIGESVTIGGLDHLFGIQSVFGPLW